MAYDIAPDTVVHRHPFRGALWGALLGCGVTLHLLSFSVVPFGTWPVLAAPVAGGLAAGVLWGRFGPVKALKGRIPAALRSADSVKGKDPSPEARRAAQLAAARKAQADLKNNADAAMRAALHEAETHVLDSVSRRVAEVVAPSAPTSIAATPKTEATSPGRRQRDNEWALGPSGIPVAARLTTKAPAKPAHPAQPSTLVSQVLAPV